MRRLPGAGVLRRRRRRRGGGLAEASAWPAARGRHCLCLWAWPSVTDWTGQRQTERGGGGRLWVTTTHDSRVWWVDTGGVHRQQAGRQVYPGLLPNSPAAAPANDTVMMTDLNLKFSILKFKSQWSELSDTIRRPSRLRLRLGLASEVPISEVARSAAAGVDDARARA